MDVRVLIAAALVGSTTAAAVELTLDRSGIDQAIAIGQSRLERDHTRFHAPYRLTVNRAPIDYIDIITPFRRIVMTAEQRTSVGDRLFGQRQALEMLGVMPQQVDVVMELTFHPMNAYVGVPDYQVVLRPPAGPAIRPRQTDRIPRFGPRVDGTPPPTSGTLIPGSGQPMLGGTIVASFDGGQLAPTGSYDVVVLEKGKEEIARGAVMFGVLR